MNISEKADKYAEGKANEAITKAIAQAYIDGYRDGYNDREQEIPEDPRENGVEYVDLGLPSGTLWSSDYLREDDKIVYLPYGKAEKMDIPTEEQWKELVNCCKIEYDTNRFYQLEKAKFIGPNGNVLFFLSMGMIKSDYICFSDEVHFWFINNYGSSKKMQFQIYNPGKRDSPPQDRSCICMSLFFTEYQLPVRLVK